MGVDRFFVDDNEKKGLLTSKQHILKPTLVEYKSSHSSTFIYGKTTRRTSLTESSPNAEYSLLRSSNNSTNLAGNQPRIPFNSPIQQCSSRMDRIVKMSLRRKPNSSSSRRSKSRRARARFRRFFWMAR
uniref:Uncharacterized protein n=1 Tax=Romanomermis culicivorax TaxID=13658 RepID=A0A915JGG3_ROMCU